MSAILNLEVEKDIPKVHLANPKWDKQIDAARKARDKIK